MLLAPRKPSARREGGYGYVRDAPALEYEVVASRLADRRSSASSALLAGERSCVVPAVRFCIALNGAALLSLLAFELVPGRPRHSDRHRRLPDVRELQRQSLLLGVRLHGCSLPAPHVRDLRRSDPDFRALERPARPRPAAARASRRGASGRVMAGAASWRLGAPSLSVSFSVSRRQSSSGALNHPALLRQACSATAPWSPIGRLGSVTASARDLFGVLRR